MDYQGQYSGPHFYLAGMTVEVVESAALRLIADGRAVEVKLPKPKAKPKSKPKPKARPKKQPSNKQATQSKGAK